MLDVGALCCMVDRMIWWKFNSNFQASGVVAVGHHICPCDVGVNVNAMSFVQSICRPCTYQMNPREESTTTVTVLRCWPCATLCTVQSLYKASRGLRAYCVLRPLCCVLLSLYVRDWLHMGLYE
jgi:hypothetical protein